MTHPSDPNLYQRSCLQELLDNVWFVGEHSLPRNITLTQDVPVLRQEIIMSEMPQKPSLQ
eukprot:4954647-Amphidinium_carterae.1